MIPVMHVYCAFCRAPSFKTSLEEPLDDVLKKRLDRQLLDCRHCGNPVGSIRYTGHSLGEESQAPTNVPLNELYPPSLFHYTSIATALKILETNSMRFSRLDVVNDPLEAYTDDLKEEPSKYVFASCWTYDERESLLFWGRYTGDKGCRLAFPTNMLLTNGGLRIAGFEGDFVVGETFNDIWTTLQMKDAIRINIKNTVLKELPPLRETNVSFSVYGPTFVGYGSDASIIKPRLVTNGQFDMRKIGIWKSAHWADEREIRFRIYATDQAADVLSKWEWESDKSPFKSYKQVMDTYLDLPLSSDAIRKCSILTAPLASEEDIQKIEKYCKNYHPRIPISRSTIRMR